MYVGECNSDKKVWRRLDSVTTTSSQQTHSGDIDSKQLDFNRNSSTSNLGTMHGDNPLPTTTTPSSTKCWSYDGPIPQFGPKKFNGKGFSSSNPGPSDNGGSSSGFGNNWKKSMISDEPELMEIDGECDNEANSPSEISRETNSPHNLATNVNTSDKSAAYKAKRKAKKSPIRAKIQKQEEYMIIPRRSTRLLNKRLANPD